MLSSREEEQSGDEDELRDRAAVEAGYSRFRFHSVMREMEKIPTKNQLKRFKSALVRDRRMRVN